MVKYMNKRMLERIYRTVSNFYITNKDVLSSEKVKDLEEQKEALEKEIKKIWKR